MTIYAALLNESQTHSLAEALREKVGPIEVVEVKDGDHINAVYKVSKGDIFITDMIVRAPTEIPSVHKRGGMFMAVSPSQGAISSLQKAKPDAIIQTDAQDAIVAEVTKLLGKSK